MGVLNFQNVHVTLVVVPTDLRCDYSRQDFFEINVEKISNFRWFFSTPLASDVSPDFIASLP